MKKLLLGGLLALVAVSANAQINSIEDKKAIDTAKQIITDNLKDPNSANFRDINVYHLTNKNTNETIGIIKSVDDSTINTLFEIETKDGKDVLIPANEDLIHEADMENRRIEMFIPEGLLDL